MTDFYILDPDHNPVPVAGLHEWATWSASQPDGGRHIAYDEIADGTISVSTVFLGIDHNRARHFGGKDTRPLLFETMVFGGTYDKEQWRWHTWQEAIRGHGAAVATARAGLA